MCLALVIKILGLFLFLSLILQHILEIGVDIVALDFRKHLRVGLGVKESCVFIILLHGKRKNWIFLKTNLNQFIQLTRVEIPKSNT